MCLGLPGRVVAVAGPVATVDFWGTRREVRLELLDEPVGPGDYVLSHVGNALRRIPEGEIEEILAVYDRLLAEAEEDASSGVRTRES